MKNKAAVGTYFTGQLAIQNVPYANNQPAEVISHSKIAGRRDNIENL